MKVESAEPASRSSAQISDTDLNKNHRRQLEIADVLKAMEIMAYIKTFWNKHREFFSQAVTYLRENNAEIMDMKLNITPLMRRKRKYEV